MRTLDRTFLIELPCGMLLLLLPCNIMVHFTLAPHLLIPTSDFPDKVS